MTVVAGDLVDQAELTARAKARRSVVEDRIFYWLTLASAVFVVVMLIGVLVSLVVGSWPALSKFGIGFIWTERWSPVKQIFGALTPIYGTIVTSLIAMIIGIPVSLGIAIFLTEICPQSLRRPIGVAIELLAGIPSIIYGLWGFFFLAPFLQTTIQPFLIATIGNVPVIGMLFLWGLKRDGDGWAGGHILDPKNGKTYNAKLSLQDAGNRLRVRGFIGTPLFGRSQTWLRQP